MQVHETAFITSTYRSYHEDISMDIYARLWNNPKTELLIPQILETISKDEAVLHSLRNRFFYERMKSFFAKNNGGTLLNFGAGFSMYQFLLDTPVSSIEIDKKDIITYKKETIDRWVKEEKIPYRETQYVALDFTTKTAQEIIEYIQPLIKKRPVFIVIEGVFFFLDRSTTNTLFTVFDALQESGDVIGCVSYLPEIKDTAVYHRLVHYFNTTNDTHDTFNHQTIATAYYNSIQGYVLQEHTDNFELSKIYATAYNIDDPTKILNENMYLLVKE